MSGAFDAGALEQNYAFLDDCPEQFFQDVVTLPVGTLAERVQGLCSWRNASEWNSLPVMSRTSRLSRRWSTA